MLKRILFNIFGYPSFIKKALSFKTELSVKKYLTKAVLEQNNKHKWEVYALTGDKEYLDEIKYIDKEVIFKSFIFHGHCHGCKAQIEDKRFCLICQYFPENSKFLWNNNDYDMYDKYSEYHYIFKNNKLI